MTFTCSATALQKLSGTRDMGPVQLGAMYLDQLQYPWRELVQIDQLDVGRESRSVLGQLYGTHTRGLEALRLTHPSHYGFTSPHHVRFPEGPSLQDHWYAELIWPYVDWARPRVKLGAEALSTYFNGRDIRRSMHPARLRWMGSDVLTELFGNYEVGRAELRKVTHLTAAQMGFHSDTPNLTSGLRQAWLMYLKGEL